ncbi:Thymic stromal cotransporter-like protein Solute carrier family 46 member 2 [Larimichthys crocea]|uniref:Thymic stromal cotransporter-like protein Solute carrier family 46 member 2 n=1 Tax=Larimichthys crocea TaxID=215358 RepID=A0A6G0I0E2_LARCR|nr:Thymic stromal cotransporter-like protein Solute carrier family 46 member 2 [Larimichthys crocea]
MVLPALCQTAFAVLRQIEPILVLEQLGSTLFDTALQMVVRDRCVNATYPDTHLSREDSQQKAMTDFYMTYSLIIQLTPILPALLLARLSDRGWRRIPIVVPLSGYLLSRLALLLVVLLQLPLEVMFGAAVVFGLSGGFSAYWPGVMTLASLSSTNTDRSQMMMRVELLYGMAGLVGSLASGHLFLLYTSTLGNGTILLIVSTLLHLLSLIFSIVLLQVKQLPSQVPADEDCQVFSQASSDVPVATPARINRVNLALLFAAAVLYSAAVGGAIEILGAFVMKEPLSWSATQVGYGNAAGCMIFLTSFLGVFVFRRCVSDVMLILIGMVSFASGIFFMSFVTETYMFYLARSLNLFALIPMPTIRSLLSQQVPASSCGTTLTSLQLSLKFAGLAYIPAFTKIYQGTLGWFPGFVFTLSSIITVLGMIPISIVGCRSPQRRHYERIQGD